MRTFYIFLKKECFEYIKKYKFFILFILYILFGVMNPLIAKYTPDLLKFLQETVPESGIVIDANISVSDLDSWQQFYKNIIILLIILFIVFSNNFSSEYRNDKLSSLVVKGASRTGIYFAKLAFVLINWTIGYYISFFITYIMNDVFWTNSNIENLFFVAFCFYFFGVWFLSLELLFAVSFKSQTMVIISQLVIFTLIYLLALIYVVRPYTPIFLTGGYELLNTEIEKLDLIKSFSITSALIVSFILSSVFIFRKKRL